MNHRFVIGEKDFLLDGKPFRVLAGAMHYFRVPRCHWRDRMRKMKACGLNTLETYAAWNLHEPEEGRFDFSGQLDLCAYLAMAQEEGLFVILRPGPYICSEWDMGGLPWWLVREGETALRCSDEKYLRAAEKYLREVFVRTASYQCTRGGPILMMQVENEYGSYGNDQDYLNDLMRLFRDAGVETELFTSDGWEGNRLTAGECPSVFRAVNFGSKPREAFAALRERQPDGPLFCAEYWCGWFDHWGEKHHVRDAEETARTLEEILSLGASVSLYMFHGGTNFGYMNGANGGERYAPVTTSYDFDALLDEQGRVTDKYFACQKVLGRFGGQTSAPPPETAEIFQGEAEITGCARLIRQLSALNDETASASPQSMEALGQGWGFTAYSAFVRGPAQEETLRMDGMRDEAWVFGDGVFLGAQKRGEASGIRFSVPPEGMRLLVLTENQGRVNYGEGLGERKGLTGEVFHGETRLYGWRQIPLPLNNGQLARLEFTDPLPAERSGQPVFVRARFSVSHPADTFVRPRGFTHAMVFLNGKPLGRWRACGPQRSLYAPENFLRSGENELILFETKALREPGVSLTDGKEKDHA